MFHTKSAALALSVGLVIVFVTSSAYADTSASANLSNLTVTLTSLDGGTPTITFYGTDSNNVTSTAYSWANNVTTTGGSYQLSGSGDVSKSVTAPNAYSSASVIGTNGGVNFPITISSKGSATLVNPSYPNNNFNASALFAEGFTLSANTVATFTASATLSATTTIGGAEGASSQVSIMTFHEDGSALDYSTALTANAGYQGSLCCGNPPGNVPPQNVTYSELLGLTVTNSTSSAADGLLLAQTSANNNTALPVPEPESYAMMLAGLGLMGFTVRRRKALMPSLKA